MSLIQPLAPLTLDQLQHLLQPSLAEGYAFVQTLWDEYQSGKTTFDGDGEALLGAYVDGHLAAVGGIHVDPYLNDPTIGRIRHVYVLPTYRRQGIGAELVLRLISQSAPYFAIITLRTTTAHGRAFYSAIGFSDVPRFPQATHWRELSRHSTDAV